VHDLRVLREQLDLLRDGMRRRGALDLLRRRSIAAPTPSGNVAR